MLSQNVVFFCQKETTNKKNTSYAVLQGHFWITKKGTTLLDSPILSFFAELLDRVGLVFKCCPFLQLTWNFLEISPPQMAHTPDTSITHVEVAAISAAARRQ